MTKNSWSCAVLVSVLCVATGSAEELVSGIPPGEYMSPLDSIKCAGAEQDGVKAGEQLCYVCKYDLRPVAAVFARSASRQVAQLLQQLNQAVVRHQEEELASFAVLWGDSREQLGNLASRLATGHRLSHLPLVVPVSDAEQGPPDFFLHADAEVTVMLYVKGEVKARHAFSGGQLDARGIDRVLSDLEKILK